ncbi:MAG: L-threonylcarbamoyladenylate synthase [Peptoniphilaceae bacterium]|nr:L-threonylcarbamoyladenylate synthase [Peptoniphilaceae bacterium]MDY6019107.1 L-threonylcarbamoyladenylate synthase [Anaerococcus sp.]
MDTKILTVNTDNIDEEKLKEASSYIKNGDLVVFPTETVYGLGADGLNGKACEKIFKAKNRPIDNPLILHISQINQLDRLVSEIPEEAKLLAKNLWPGPLTMIFKKSKLIPDVVTATGDTVAIRMPKDPIARRFIDFCDTPIAAPSANISGRPSPTNASDVYFDMKGRVSVIIDGGNSQIGIESTVLDLTEDKPMILRPGFYTYEYIKGFLPNLVLDDSLVDDKVIPKSPGQKYKHYAPKAAMKIYVGEESAIRIYDEAREAKKSGKKVGILAFEQDISKFYDFDFVSLGDKNNLLEMSHVLFSALRILDKKGVDLILAQGVEDKDLGKSIMNRMKKSAAGNVIYL